MKRNINLLPVQFRCRQLMFRIFKSWMLIYGFSVLLMVCAAWWTWAQHSEQTIALDAVRMQYAPIRKLEAESREFKKETRSMQQREKLALQLSRHRSIIALLGQLSISARNCNGNVNINRMQLNSNVGSKDAAEPSKLTLTGVGVDDVAIAQFVAELRDSEMFDNVQLTSSGSTMVEDQESKIYTLECTYQ